MPNPVAGEIPPKIHRKLQASSKRARRWVPMPPTTDVPQCAGSAQPATETTAIPTLFPNELTVSGTPSQADNQIMFSDVAELSQALGNSLVHTRPSTSSMLTSNDLQSSSQQSLLAATNGFAQSSDFHITDLSIWPESTASDLQSLGPGPDSFESIFLSQVDQPGTDNVILLSLFQDPIFSHDLPFASLEHTMRSNGITIQKYLGHPTYSGLASRSIATIFPCRDKAMGPRSPTLKLYLQNLGSLVPGESLELVADSQTLTPNLARVLIFSMMNGLAGLDGMPKANILGFVGRFIVNDVFLDILGQCPTHVLRTLADNIFRMAVEATDTQIVESLLSRGFIDADQTVCFQEGLTYTPIQRAVSLGSLDLIRLLIGANADVNKFYHNNNIDFGYSTLDNSPLAILVNKIYHETERGRFTIQPKLVEAFYELVTAGAQLKPELIVFACERRAADLFCLICKHLQPETHRDFLDMQQYIPTQTTVRIAKCMGELSALRFFGDIFRHCNQLCSNECLTNGHKVLRSAAIAAAASGKLELVQLLVGEAKVDPRTPGIFTGAIASQNYDLIDFILSFGPNFDPPAIDVSFEDRPSAYGSTPIAEAVRYGNEVLIEKLEAAGSLDHLTEGDRFGPLLSAAAETGNVDYVKKLLHQRITVSRESRRPQDPLTLAARGGHREVVRMLLNAGATRESRVVDSGAFREAVRLQNADIIRDLIEFQTPHMYNTGETYSEINIAATNCSIITIIVEEYPGPQFVHMDDARAIVKQCIKEDRLPLFKCILQMLEHTGEQLDACLQTAVECRHSDLMEYLIGVGANPFNRKVLQCTLPDRPDLLRQLLKQERRRENVPMCIGANILEPLIEENPEVVKLLLERQAINFTRLESMSHQILENSRYLREECALTPLGLAIQGSPQLPKTNLTAMERFLQAGANANEIARTNGCGSKSSPLMTALVVAVGTGQEDAVMMLLNYGALVDARPRLGTTRTALQYAAETGNANMVKLLLKHNANADDAAPPRGGATAFQFAAISGNLTMADTLLACGARLGALPSKIDGRWPLEGAAEAGRLDMISFLWKLYLQSLQSGEPCNGFSDRQCLRAMNFARLNGHIGCVNLISEMAEISVDRLETDNYGEPWMAYEIDHT